MDVLAPLVRIRRSGRRSGLCMLAKPGRRSFRTVLRPRLPSPGSPAQAPRPRLPSSGSPAQAAQPRLPSPSCPALLGWEHIDPETYLPVNTVRAHWPCSRVTPWWPVTLPVRRPCWTPVKAPVLDAREGARVGRPSYPNIHRGTYFNSVYLSEHILKYNLLV